MTKQEYNKTKAEIESLKSDENIKSIATIVHMIDNEEISLSRYDLTEAVIKQLGYDKGNARELLEAGMLLEDISNHGARDTAGGGFVYNEDLIKFFDENRNGINDLIEVYYVDTADTSGRTDFINSLESVKRDDEYEYTKSEVADTLCNRNGDNPNVQNLKCALTYFAVEEVAKTFKEIRPEHISSNSFDKAKTMINNHINKELKNLEQEYNETNTENENTSKEHKSHRRRR